MNKSLTSITTAALALTLVAGCAQRRPAQLPPAPPTGSETGSTGQSGVGPDGLGQAAVPGSRADFLATVPSDRVYFGFDSFGIDAQSQATLDAQAQWLARYPNVVVTIEGHADERGTREYNLALGDRRANAVRDYLQSRGVSPQRMQVISWGKERPAAQGWSEEAHAQNRRAVTVLPQ